MCYETSLAKLNLRVLRRLGAADTLQQTLSHAGLSLSLAVGSPLAETLLGLGLGLGLLVLLANKAPSR